MVIWMKITIIIAILEKRGNLGKIERELGGGQMWMKLSGSETGNTIASDTSLGLSCRHISF